MNKKALVYGLISLGCFFIMLFGLSKLNVDNASDEVNVISKLGKTNKIEVSYYPEDDSVDIKVKDYNLKGREINKHLKWGVKKLKHYNKELFSFIEDVKEKLKGVDKFEYDDTGVYYICEDKRIGKYEVSVEVTDEEYIGYPLVVISIIPA